MSNRSKGRSRPRQHVQTEQVNPIRRGEVIDLGEFGGEERAPLTASFRYFGDPIRVHPDLSELDVIDFLEAAETLNSQDPRTMTMIKQFIRRCVHADDFEDFWESVREHHQTAQEVMELMWKVIEGVSGNPTGPPSVSSDGRPVTTVSLPPDSLRPESPSEETDPTVAAFRRQIERFEQAGRPDSHPTAGTPNGVAIAAQIAAAAEARGLKIDRDPSEPVSA